MNRQVQIVFDRLRSLGTPGEMGEAALHLGLPSPVPEANAHVHLPPNFSAFRSVEQAVRLASEQGVHALGASNYYDFGVYAELASRAWDHGIFPLFGLEIIALLDDLQRAEVLINDPGNHGRMYICGKGIVRFAPETPEAGTLLRWIRASDTERMRHMVAKMARLFAAQGVETGLDDEQILERIARRHGLDRDSICLQERHVAQAFQEEFFRLVGPSERSGRLSSIMGSVPQAGPEDSLKVQQEIRSALMKVGKPAFVTERFANFAQAYRLILELGGIPCYPTLADGAKPICPYEDPPDRLVDSLQAARIYCAEFIPIRNRPEVLERYVRTMRSAGMVITAGTEHNTPDMLPLVPRCVQNLPVPEHVRRTFWEGTCVVAAHQFLVLHGECGYVDAAGAPNPEFKDSESRIAFFAGLGAAILARYHEKSLGTR